MVDTIVPDGYSSLNATCSRNGGDQLEYKFFPSYLYIAPVAQDDVVSCVWYFVPWEPRDAFLTLRVFNCPPGMTAETLAPEACEAVTEGFDIGIGSLLGLMEPYTLADATQDGTAFRWALGPASPPGPHSDFGQWAIGESPLPVGYDSYVIIGDAVRSFERGAYHIDTSGENSHAELSLYNFASAQVEEPTEEPGEEPIEAPTQTPVVEGLPAHVHGGECDQLQIDSFVELTDLTEPEGDAEGSSQAVAVESSYSVIDISLNELLASDYSIVLHENRETHDDDLACGEVGGVRDAGGAVTVGLSEVNSSGFVGIAYLAPLPDDPTQTQVSLFAAERLAGDEQVTPGG